MRGHRAKQYRKLMHQYGLTFGFREPYQVLLDAQTVQDAARFKMDLIPALERTLQGKVKPMITQCSMRHLYSAEPKDEALIDQAKTYERRRCNHHELPEPLTTIACLSEVVDPKDGRTNKHRYVVASQDADVRARMRRIPGVPLIYISRSVMILEPMAGATENFRAREERNKFKAGLKPGGRQILGKRSRQAEQDEQGEAEAQTGEVDVSMAKKTKGPKGPNPLSVKKPKKDRVTAREKGVDGAGEELEKRKRRKRKRTAGNIEAQGIAIAA